MTETVETYSPVQDPSLLMDMDRAKRRLALLWFLCAGGIFFLVILQAVFGRFGDRASDAFGWLLPTFMPTLSLIASVLIWDAFGAKTRHRMVNRFLYRLTFWLSALYLLAVVLTIGLQPFTTSSLLDLMSQSNLYLGPFQGLVVACLGTFFVNSDNLAQQQLEDEITQLTGSPYAPSPSGRASGHDADGP